MAKRTKSLPKVQGFVLFDVTYADGSRASNRRVPAEILGGTRRFEARLPSA